MFQIFKRIEFFHKHKKNHISLFRDVNVTPDASIYDTYSILFHGIIYLYSLSFHLLSINLPHEA